MKKNRRREVVQALAEAFLAGTWHLRSLMARGDSALGAGGTWLSELAFAVMQHFREPPLDRVELLADFIATNPFFQDAWTKGQISWVAQLNPTRGAKLQREFDALSW